MNMTIYIEAMRTTGSGWQVWIEWRRYDGSKFSSAVMGCYSSQQEAYDIAVLLMHARAMIKPC